MKMKLNCEKVQKQLYEMSEISEFLKGLFEELQNSLHDLDELIDEVSHQISEYEE